MKIPLLVKLVLNTGFLVNRYPDPESWTAIIGDLQVKNVQLTADLFSPHYPDSIIEREAEKILDFSSKYGFNISSMFTGAFTRVNHFCHPNEDIREFWFNWFCSLAKLAQSLDCNRIGSHVGIMSIIDDIDNRRLVQKRCINYWKRLAECVGDYGIKDLTWEHMSISREQGHTLQDINQILADFKSSSLPIKMCLDPDHGDLSSSDSRDYEPYGLIEKYLPQSSQIHLKQISYDKRKNTPFTSLHNESGLIDAVKVLNIFKTLNLPSQIEEDFEFILEINARERQPDDKNIVADIAESVQYWKGAFEVCNLSYE